jgi:hypothetical protein
VSAREYLSALRRRWLIIVAAVAVALAAAWVTTSSIAVPKQLPKASSYSATNLMSGSAISSLWRGPGTRPNAMRIGLINC